MTTVRRVGILTGGGDCPGLNAVIRAVTKTLIFEQGLEVMGIADGFVGLIENRIRLLTPDAVSNILTRGGTVLGTSNKATPRHYPAGKDSVGNTIFHDVTDRVLQHIAEHGIEVLVIVGGDGTMSSAVHLIRHGIHLIGVPKTIDNDLMHTEITFGFQTAVETATEAIDRLHTTAASHHRVMLVETMGRNAGWLALNAGIAGGADVILIPEIPYRLDVIAAFCQQRVTQGKSSTIIAVSEGARPAGGAQTVDQIVGDSFEQIRLGGVSRTLARQIGHATGIEVRDTILGHVQRGGTPCAFDRVLATKLGHAATQLIAQGRWDRMVAVQQGRITDVAIEDVADQERQVPLDCQEIQAARGVGTCFGDYPSSVV